MPSIHFTMSKLLPTILVITFYSIFLVVAATSSTALAQIMTEDEYENTTSRASEIAKLPSEESMTGSSTNANDISIEGISTNATTALSN